MLTDLHLAPLQDRRKANHLVFFFKVVEGLVPALQTHDYLTPVCGKRQIKSRQLKDCDTHNIIDRQVTNNSRCFKTVQCNSELLKKHSFSKLSSRTILKKVLCTQRQWTASRRPSTPGSKNIPSSLPSRICWKALRRNHPDPHIRHRRVHWNRRVRLNIDVHIYVQA